MFDTYHFKTASLHALHERNTQTQMLVFVTLYNIIAHLLAINKNQILFCLLL